MLWSSLISIIYWIIDLYGSLELCKSRSVGSALIESTENKCINMMHKNVYRSILKQHYFCCRCRCYKKIIYSKEILLKWITNSSPFDLWCFLLSSCEITHTKKRRKWNYNLQWHFCGLLGLGKSSFLIIFGNLKIKTQFFFRPSEFSMF